MDGQHSNGIRQDILDIIDGRRARILLALADGALRFGRLRSSMGLSQKTLAADLHALERAGLLTRTVYAEVPPRVEYALTASGCSLREMLLLLNDWSREHLMPGER